MAKERGTDHNLVFILPSEATLSYVFIAVSIVIASACALFEADSLVYRY